MEHISVVLTILLCLQAKNSLVVLTILIGHLETQQTVGYLTTCLALLVKIGGVMKFVFRSRIISLNATNTY